METLRTYFKLYDGPRLRHLAQTVATASPRLATRELPDAQPYKLERRVTPELVAQLAAAYQAGESTIALAKRYPLGRKSIASLLADEGVEIRWTRLTTEQVDRACTLYLEDGLSLATIASVIGGSPGSARRAIVSRGVELRPRGGNRRSARF